MSKIIDKTFDASKKIIRSIFRGSPNLVTSSDLNRQFEAIKFQLDSLDDKVGGVSDVEVTPILKGNTLKVDVDYSYMEFKGCAFKPTNTSDTINLTESAPIVYVCLVADTKEVTFDNDTTREISGAVFEDGVSYPAADNITYIDERIVLSHSVLEISNFVGVIAVIKLVDGEVKVIKNTTLRRVPFEISQETFNMRVYPITDMNLTDFAEWVFYLPEHYTISVGDIIEICIPYVRVDTEGGTYIAGINGKIYVSSIEAPSVSGYWPVGKSADVTASCFLDAFSVQLNPRERTLTFTVTQENVSEMRGPHIVVYKP